MYMTTLRKVGGSVMLAVPPALLDVLHLKAGAPVGVDIDHGRLVVEPKPRPRYSLDQLIAECEPEPSRGADDAQWLGDKAAGRELL